ncbi:hypothetical protein FQA47_016160 [Oryzias melastigma]|uniref:Uncharacterized protein n=1 Tax=Oryzias melastigma TaxID=30732 RepID=A0A834FWX6_ORYME|nr:hypothetical protein FQA47_016160 [Oryzias melastigma]
MEEGGVTGAPGERAWTLAQTKRQQELAVGLHGNQDRLQTPLPGSQRGNGSDCSGFSVPLVERMPSRPSLHHLKTEPETPKYLQSQRYYEHFGSTTYQSVFVWRLDQQDLRYLSCS